jgi:lactoylglutathione lyase
MIGSVLDRTNRNPGNVRAVPYVMGAGLHVRDVGKSIDFYTNLLGMKVIDRVENASMQEVTLSYGDGPGSGGLILIERSDHPEPYEHGDALRKVVLVVADVRGICAQVREWGCDVEREPVDLAQFGFAMAFVLDPDGYRLELLEPL